MGVAGVAAALDAARSRHSLDAGAGQAADQEFRAGHQRVLSDRDGPAADARPPPAPQVLQFVAVRDRILRRALRAPPSPARDAVPAAGDDGILMRTALSP